jgi:hypothetical protein
MVFPIKTERLESRLANSGDDCLNSTLDVERWTLGVCSPYKRYGFSSSIALPDSISAGTET